MGIDYLLYAHRERRLTFRQWFLLLAPQILACVIVISIYNPLMLVASETHGDSKHNFVIDRLLTIWNQFKSINDCEFCSGIIVLIGAPMIYFTRNTWLLRGVVAFFCYVVTAGIIAPQTLSIAFCADVRYLTPLIPLCIGISALVIVLLTKGRWYFSVPLSVAVFGFNILNYPFTPSYWCSTPAKFIGELCNPRDTSISLAAKWIEEHIHEGESIVVYPTAF